MGATEVSAAEHTRIFCNFLPRRSGVSGLENLRAAADCASVVRIELKRKARRVNYASVIRRSTHVDDAGFFIFEEAFIPMLAAVRRLEHTALRAGCEVIISTNQDDVWIAWIDND